jgi:hypothetical protein
VGPVLRVSVACARASRRSNRTQAAAQLVYNNSTSSSATRGTASPQSSSRTVDLLPPAQQPHRVGLRTAGQAAVLAATVEGEADFYMGGRVRAPRRASITAF